MITRANIRDGYNETGEANQAREEIASQRDKLREQLKVLLDHVDYTSGHCSQTEMVGAVLPMVVIKNARAVISK